MGKIHISDDLKNKLGKVLLPQKNNDSQNISEISVAPAPKWKVDPIKEETTLVKDNKIIQNINEKFFELGYLNWAKVVFFTSFIGGIGLTLGVKVGRIIFY